MNKKIFLIACLFVILESLKAQDITKEKEKKVNVSITPSLNIVDKNYASDIDPEINLLGFSVKYSSRNLNNRFYFSYGLLIDRSLIKDKDIRSLANDSEFEYQYNLSYTYIAPSLEFNYLILNKKSHRVGISTGLLFKYYLSKSLELHLSSGVQNSSIHLSDISNNYFYNNPSHMTSIWYEWELNTKLFLSTSIYYSYDMNFSSSVPSFQKFGISLGLTFDICKNQK
ncbi:MAG: hypothetical protein N4A32_03385 [Marinifilaceae bacterium]|jgi:hypothetical protein|nr:hypothetical protein [Marinifilaceae bacterium]